MKISKQGKSPNRKNTPTKIAGSHVVGYAFQMHSKAFDNFDSDKNQSFKVSRRAKFVPKGIDPAYPQKNFVKAHYENKGDMEGFYSYLYPRNSMGPMGQGEVRKTPHGYGHKHRCGDLRLSGSPRAYQIGKKR